MTSAQRSLLDQLMPGPIPLTGEDRTRARAMQLRGWVEFTGDQWRLLERGRRALARNAKTSGVDADGKAGGGLERFLKMHFERLGWRLEIAEPKKVRAGRFWKTLKHDFYGCVDIQGFHSERNLWMVIQSGTNAAEKRKALEQFQWPTNTIVLIALPDRRAATVDAKTHQIRIEQWRSGGWEELAPIPIPKKEPK